MIDLEERVAAHLHARVTGLTVEPDLDDVVARARVVTPAGRLSRRVVLGAAASLVAIAVGGLVIVGGRNDESPLTFGAAPPAGAGSYPVIDTADLPAELRDDVVGEWAYGDGYESWSGVVGTVGDHGPADLIAVTVYPRGLKYASPAAHRGRRDDVMEIDGGTTTTLIWTVADQYIWMVGNDRATMYEFVDFVEPIDDSPERSGYDWTAELPDGFTELVAPTQSTGGPFPRVGTSDGRLTIDVVAEPSLVSFAASGIVPTRSVLGPPPGYGADIGDGAVLTLALNGTESVLISSRTIALDDLITIASHIRFVDEETWRALYDVVFECTGCDGTLSPPVTPPTSD